ncbi:MAG TPA: hypothetical protein VFR64_20110 [Methylomirabilota bacterium]|nr:hypothetical protein [Methylomirabilota bacterium]
MDALRIRRPLAVLAIAVAISMGLRSAAAVARDAVVQYVYAEVGRLIAVVDQQGNIALCTYDASGNVLRIDRVDADEIPGPLGIALVRPRRGKVGTVVDIFGLDIRAILRPPGRAAVDARGLVGALPSGSTSQGMVSGQISGGS